MDDPKWIQCHLKKEKKINLHFYSSNVIKGTRIVTRLALNLQGSVHGALQHSRGTQVSQDSHPDLTARLCSAAEEQGFRDCHIYLLSCLSNCCKPLSAAFRVPSSECVESISTSKLHYVFGPSHTRVLFSPFF